MMFGCDGCITRSKNKHGSHKVKIVYSSSSLQLAKDVRQLLLKYELVAQLYKIKVKYKGEYRSSWQVVLQDVDQLNKFLSTIGFVGEKQTKGLNFLDGCSEKTNRNIDLIPPEIWQLLNARFVNGKTHYNCRRKLKTGGDKGRGKEGHCGTKGRSINRAVLSKIAGYLDKDDELNKIASSDVVWDEIISISYIGDHQTYDISMPFSPNFVVDGFVTHNTNVMLNLALNLYERGHSVLFIPLEMNRHDLINRMIANRCDIPHDKIARIGELDKAERDKIRQKIDAAKIWLEGTDAAKLYILDSDERTSVSRLKRELEKKALVFKPKVVIIDYVANLEPDIRFGQRNDLEIGEILKSLRFLGKQYGFHIISAAQMGRSAIKAMKESGFNSSSVDSTSIRGSHEYSADADNIFALIKVPNEEDKLKIYSLKARYGPSGQTAELGVNPQYCRVYGTMTASLQSHEIDALFKEPPELSQTKKPTVVFNTTNDEEFDKPMDDLSSLGI
jgi:replicative DNA helicase